MKNEEFYCGWCPLTGELPGVDYNPSEFKFRCIQLIYEARLFCDEIEADEYPHPEDLLRFARYMEEAYMSICDNSLYLQRPFYYTNEKGKTVLRNTLVSENEQMIDVASNYNYEHTLYNGDYYGAYDEVESYFINAVMAIITAYRALEEALEDKIYHDDDLVTARELFSIAKIDRIEFKKAEKQSIIARDIKKDIIDQAIKNIFKSFPNSARTLGTVRLYFNKVNEDKNFEGFKVNFVEGPETGKGTVFIERPGDKKIYKYKERTLERRIKKVIEHTLNENKFVTCKDYIK